MSPSLLDFLRHILHECDHLLQLKQGRDRSELLDDPAKSRVSEVLDRQRKLTVEMIRKLSETLRIPTEVLVEEY